MYGILAMITFQSVPHTSTTPAVANHTAPVPDLQVCVCLCTILFIGVLDNWYNLMANKGIWVILGALTLKWALNRIVPRQ